MYLIFFGFFAAEGIIYPFWSTWLHSLGFSSSQAGILIAAAYWPQVISGVLLTYVADWRLDQIRLAAMLALSAAFFTLMFCFAPAKPYAFVALSILFGGLWMVVLPLCESYLLQRDKQALQNYGWVRAIGSLSFILMSSIGGMLFTRYGQSWVPIAISVSMVSTALSCLWVRHRITQAPSPALPRTVHRPDWKRLFEKKILLLVIAAASFIQLSHTLYFSTASIRWEAQGYSSTAVGIFWSIAVLAEIIYFAFSNKILTRCPPLPLVVFSGVCATARWTFFSSSEAMSLIVLGQCMHALSFAAYHSAIMRFIRDHAPSDIRAFTQGVYYSIAVALPMGLAAPFAGYLYETVPARSYYVMALFSLVGALVALVATQKTQSSNDVENKSYSRLL